MLALGSGGRIGLYTDVFNDVRGEGRVTDTSTVDFL